MRTIKRTALFRKDFKRELKGRHRLTLENDFLFVIQSLANDLLLPPKYRDHALTGNWQDCRDCHLKPDLLLVYRKPIDDALHLLRLGSHAELDF